MLIALIVACEIGFWVILAAGLAARYLLRLRRTSTALLIAVPLIDVVLLVASVIDLRRGAEPSAGHGLAAAYIGFSVAFGHRTMRWADERFAHRFAGGPPPSRPPRERWARVRYEWVAFGRAVLGWVVASGLLLAAYPLIGDPDRAAPLLAWIPRLGVVVVFWLIFGPLLEMVFPTRTPASGPTPPVGTPGRSGR